ncbi:hypothetical protein [Liquorilactobacillus capillatus]|uniref:Uncharacterized protein n=1 Tax=Liquorilactobacillus capillatus DSM 19910 TaxID=1423731 RepID=A0A0R1M9L1_9LACO|nr:hypothetical protein [Liquorilactobacillus capillatus]KRL00707.1 hypothetical protein FC81_GL001881 [Liquorilactobacillus capillatus DSM 19910]
MLELKKTTFQQLTQSLQSQFALTDRKRSSSFQQMPRFQLKLFIDQAIRKHKLIKLYLLDTQNNEFTATGYMSRSKDHQNYFKLATSSTRLLYLINLNQIKYLVLAGD